MLTPPVKIGSLPEIRAEEIILLFYFISLIFSHIKSGSRNIARTPTSLLLFGLPLVLLLSLSYSSLHNLPVTPQDLNQISRFFKYIAIYILAKNSINCADDSKKIFQCLFNYTLILFFITIQQYFNIGGINQYYIKFVAPTQYESLIGIKETVRSVGMIGNPNELGFLYAVIGIVFLNQVFNNFSNYKSIIINPFIILGILMTQSRTSLIAYVAGAAVTLILNSKSVKTALYVFIGVTVSIVIGIYLSSSSYLPMNLLDRFYYIMNFTEDESWQLRVNYHWEENLSMFYQYPFAGTGPLRSIGQAVADNEWILLLRTYGIVGTIYIICLFVIGSFVGNKANITVISITIASFIYMTTSAVFHSLVLMPLILLFFGLKDSIIKKGGAYE